jgi:3-deoxy-manno-octulosonate cytidylyltransferase (CMP-KDO synthetase)
MYSDAVVIIPARIASTRLENKPLQMIGNKTMIEHVVSRVSRIEVAGVFVATDSEEIVSLVTSKGFSAIMTDKNCLTGTDRVYEAFKKLPHSTAIKYVINVQGDMPFIDEAIIPKIIEGLKTGRFDIMTSVLKVGKDIAGSPSNVKVVIDKNNKALYFSRSLVPSGASEFLYHVGIYGFKAPLLEKFVLLEQSENEKSENLEQLRALDNGMTIGVCYSNEIPISVDTKEDLAKARGFVVKNPGYLT